MDTSNPPEQPLAVTATLRKLGRTSRGEREGCDSSSSSGEDELEWEGTRSRIFEIYGLQSALTASVCCIQCHSGGMTLQEDLERRQGLFTCFSCNPGKLCSCTQKSPQECTTEELQLP